MRLSRTTEMCERSGVNKERQSSVATQVSVWTLFACLACSPVFAETSDNTAATNSAPKAEAAPATASRGPDESAFSIVSERNIFNANRSGGTVRLASRRASTVESFTLVGTMTYEKGTFAFFDGTSSEYTKALKADSVIAGHKLVIIQTSSVKLEADGKQFELSVGSQMRREDAGLWQMAEATGSSSGSSSYSSSRNGRSGRSEFSSRSRRNGNSSNGGDNSEPARQSTSTTENSSDNSDKDEILKRLMERREKESQ